MKRLFYLSLFKIFILVAGFLFSNSVFAQCPITNSCTPGTAPSSAIPFGMGIYQVGIGSGTTGFTFPTTGGVADGYKNYSCKIQATIKESVATTISVTTNPNSDENVRAWIDLNNNGTIEAATELVFSSNNARVHNGTITIPASATVVKNTVLRLRVSSDDNSSPIPSPCSTPKFGQVEDYGIRILPNTSKPTVDFSVNNPITCSPTVQFTDLTQNGATSYLWSFGDNTTSTAQNPSHTYATTGNYTVKLKACNANGCDSITETNFVTYHTNVPIAATCTPTTVNYCCGYGITKVTFGTLENTSLDGGVGYEDFTCTKSITVEEGQNYPIALETSNANNQDTWIYIDYNNNGLFETTELVFTKLNYKNPTGRISILSGQVLNTPLRIRIISDALGTSSGPCTIRTNGQVEDYTLIITKPRVSFTSNYSNICQSQVQFNGSSNISATSWTWNFGNGSTSTLQNPIHTFSSSGIYTVKLKACKGATCDSMVKINYIAITSPCKTYCSPSIPNSNLAITQVKFNTLNNISVHETNGYGNYTNLATSITKAGYYPLNVSVNYNAATPIRTVAWIDYNQDGNFNDTGEEVANVKSSKISKIIYIPPSVSSGVTRLRVLTQPDSLTVTSCATNLPQGEMEDYSIEIKPITSKPVAYFNSLENACNALKVAFADSSSNLPTTFQWNFGDPASGAANISSQKSATHTFSSPGIYTIKLMTCNSFGCDSLQKTITVQNTVIPTPVPNWCTPSGPAQPRKNFGISSVTLNTISNGTSGDADGYKDYTCGQQTSLAQLNSYTLTVQTSLPPQTNYYEKVMAWIDFNNDSYFDIDEVVLNSINQMVHTANITPTLNAVTYQPLRMRVVNIFSASHILPQITPCSSLDLGEAEDYTITIIPYPNKPGVAFTQDAAVACGSPIQFRDTSSFFPTSWQWDFGDPASGANNTSTLKTPSHSFSSPGSYNITLTACNANGCNTITKTNYVSVSTNITLPPAPCKPQTINYCCNYGIQRVGFGAGGPPLLNAGFSNTSGNASEGYRDFSCTSYSPVYAGSLYTLGVITFSNAESVSAWIDFNNDGTFSSNEQILYSGPGSNLITVTDTFPQNAVQGVYLRLRVISEQGNNLIFDPCRNVLKGQAEDYAIKIVSPPEANFVFDQTCDGTVAFTDSSINTPTSWLWNFNDPSSGTANISTLQKPVHTFANPGSYTVTFRACNTFGCHTIYKKLVIGISPAVSLLPACKPKSSSNKIYKVTFGGINNITTNGLFEAGYKDYSCIGNTTVLPGNSYPISIQTDYRENTYVWIDYNNDGTFSTSERVFFSPDAKNHSGTITIPYNTVKNTYLRMRVYAADQYNPITGPCSASQGGQAEDYAIMVLNPSGIKETDFATQVKLYPNPSNGTFSLEMPSVSKGEFQLEVQDLAGKTVAKQALKVTENQSQQVNFSQLSKGIYLLKISNSEVSTVKKIIVE